MSLFNMNAIQGATTAAITTYLTAGIHNVTFKGMAFNDGNMPSIDFEFATTEGGIHRERIFEPTSSAREQKGDRQLASQAEQFLCKIRQIIDALNPDLGAAIDAGTAQLNANSFSAYFTLLKQHLEPKVGTETQIKLVPTSGRYVGFGYLASVSKEGTLFMSTKAIGTGLSLSAWELGQIDKFKNATPTTVTKGSASAELDTLMNTFADAPATTDDGMPF